MGEGAFTINCQHCTTHKIVQVDTLERQRGEERLIVLIGSARESPYIAKVVIVYAVVEKLRYRYDLLSWDRVDIIVTTWRVRIVYPESEMKDTKAKGW